MSGIKQTPNDNTIIQYYDAITILNKSTKIFCIN